MAGAQTPTVPFSVHQLGYFSSQLPSSKGGHANRVAQDSRGHWLASPLIFLPEDTETPMTEGWDEHTPVRWEGLKP